MSELEQRANTMIGALQSYGHWVNPNAAADLIRDLLARIATLTAANASLVTWREIATDPPPDGPPGFIAAVMDGDDVDGIEWLQGPVSTDGKRWNLNSNNRTSWPATHWAPLLSLIQKGPTNDA